jgi:acyl carrier protein
MKNFNRIVSERFKIEENLINDSLTAKDIPEWDSMNYLLFIADLEKEFGVSFTMDEVLSADSLGVIKKALENKGAKI